jgi:hypothetical protein
MITTCALFVSNQIMNNERQWRAWFDKDSPEEEIIPDNYSTSLDTFRKLLLIRFLPSSNNSIASMLR